MEHSVAKGSPSLQRFFGAALPGRSVAEKVPASRHTLRRKTASTMKIIAEDICQWEMHKFSELKQRIKHKSYRGSRCDSNIMNRNNKTLQFFSTELDRLLKSSSNTATPVKSLSNF